MLGIDAGVELVGLDDKNNMATPANVYNVGWYSLGVKPGEIGQAVIDGHINTPNHQPSVFSRLKELEIGDLLGVQDANGRIYRFQVHKIDSSSIDNFPLEEIFGPADSPKLNLITCDGVYDPLRKTYDRRTVVYADLIL